MENETIVALATPPGQSAIAVIRMSGPAALAIGAAHFRGGRSPERSLSHRILFGTFVGFDGSALDAVLLSIFRAPRSYTGEDVVEISSHGGSAIPRAILESLIAGGARPARPGEFTERAYRNGKLDLAQAESVAALVQARSERAAKAARAALGGVISRRIAELDRELIPLLAEVEARIDFPGDVAEGLDGRSLANRCARVAAPLRDWLTEIPSARRREQGLRVALVGRPNAGKSSLLNALLGYERAIVSEIPGTTRDTVEESIWLEGVELRLTDSAGVRRSGDTLDRLGVERAGEAARASDLAILVLDRSSPLGDEDRDAAALIAGRPTVVAWNKMDLIEGRAAADGPGGDGYRVAAADDVCSLGLSPAQLLGEAATVAVRPGGAGSLRAALRSALPRVLGDAVGEELPTTSARQEILLREALEALDRAGRGLREDASYDLIAVDLTEARRLLGEIVGRGVDEDVLAAIFAKFCIGK